MSSTRSRNVRAARRGVTSRSGQGATARSLRPGPGRERREGQGGIRVGSDNIFADLGFDYVEAANLQLRSTLMTELERRMEAAALTQADFAKLLGVSQPRISDLVRGKIDRFSVDTLIDLLTRAGAEVRVTVR